VALLGIEEGSPPGSWPLPVTESAPAPALYRRGEPMGVFRDNVSRCRERAELCRAQATSARSHSEEEAWLDLADTWTGLAEAFERADQPTLH
jgi:hypothetical protein